MNRKKKILQCVQIQEIVGVILDQENLMKITFEEEENKRQIIIREQTDMIKRMVNSVNDARYIFFIKIREQ